MKKILLKPFYWIFLGMLSSFKAVLIFFKWVSLGIVKVFIEIISYISWVFKYFFAFLKNFIRYFYIGFSFIFIKPFMKNKKKDLLITKINYNNEEELKKNTIENVNLKKDDLSFLTKNIIHQRKKRHSLALKKEDSKFVINDTDNILPKQKIDNVKKDKNINKTIKDDKKKYKNKKKEKEKLIKSRELLLNELSHDIKREEKKTTYRYIAKDPDGKIVKGIFSGFSKLDVNAFLVNEGYTVYKIETSKMIEFLFGQSSTFGVKMSNKDLIFWLTQLSTYLKAGITLTDAMRILSKQMKSPSKRRIFENIVYQLTLGEAFSSSLEKQTNVFPSLLINMLKAAEATGELEETLDDMANYYTEIESTRKQMISAMTYPSIITVFSIAVITFILLYVIPKFVDVYDQAGIKINSFTSAIINISTFLKNNISFIILGIILVIFIIVIIYKKIKAFREFIQKFLMHLPIVGKVIIYNEITIFTKTFSSLLKNNVLITDSIGILSKVTKNEVYKDIMFNTISNITKGEKISESFKNNWAVPDVAYYMIVTGESTGELAEMLNTVSKYYQEQHRSIVNNLKAFIEPIMIVTLAVIVGGIILAVIIPMFDLYNNIR